MTDSRRRDQVSVENLATCRRTDPDVALHARIRQSGIRAHGSVRRRRVAFDAEILLIHGGEPEAVVVVVTGDA